MFGHLQQPFENREPPWPSLVLRRNLELIDKPFIDVTKEQTMRDVLTIRDLLSPTGRDRVSWQEWIQPGRAGAQIHSLWLTDEGASAFLVAFAPDSHGDLHEHTGYELMFVLSGRLCNDNGDSYEVGDLIIEKPTSIHQVSSPEGCVLLVVRDGPAIPVADLVGAATSSWEGVRDDRNTVGD